VSYQSWRVALFKINLRISASVAVFAAVGGLLGYWAESSTTYRLDTSAIVVGVVAGCIYGLALGLYLVQRKRRWIGTASLVVLVLFVFVSSGWFAAFVTVASMVITTVILAGLLRDLYNGSEIEALRHLLRVWTSAKSGFVVVSEGRIAIPSTPPPHFGPQLVIVRPGNAVIMVNYGMMTRICGPSVFMSDSFEYVNDVFSITRIHKSFEVADAASLDGVSVTIRMSCTYGINISEQSISGQNGGLKHADGARGLTSDEIETLRSLVVSGFSVLRNVGAIIEGAVRNEISRHKFCAYQSDYSLLAADISEHLEREICSQGIIIENVVISEFMPHGTLPVEGIEPVATAGVTVPKWQALYELHGQPYKMFHEAILSAFTDESLARMVTIHLDEKYTIIASGSDLEARAFNLIEWAIRNGRLPDLVRSALEANPGNHKLRSFVDSL